ncbi:MAG: cytidylate kinase [Limisphaerales bacterium]|jgi:cytidylate kinase
MSLTIAIDGYSACGKSTLARRLAEELGYIYIDTGAMYRAVTLFFLRRELDWTDAELSRNVMRNIFLQFIPEPNKLVREIHLNGENVEFAIRSMQVADRVSELAMQSEIRKALVNQQREMAKEGGVVLDGRDIGTVVFPNAELKFFVTASMQVRIVRRHTELSKANLSVSLKEVEENLKKRDLEETTRTDSPLKLAEDAITLDTSEMNVDQVLSTALTYVHQKQSKEEV